MPLQHDARKTALSVEQTIPAIRSEARTQHADTESSERSRFCVMIFAGSGKYNDHMRQLSVRLKRSCLPIESIDTKHGLVEVVVNGSLSDLNNVFFRMGHELEEIIHP